ncbi:hypothetical protein COD13_22785 [Priestia megaterium]|uniref:DUF3298 and DUF4163 domain-containing protein n=1 Tax=Priestia megaterium TaxID=1404 RepID=UPI000BEDAEC8|nr:DUF3298 and DUF4163 domain-containing protein [Priestia megaterium]PEA37114.1 hypothetical protein CON45_21375 [Priestia megaterium]PEE45672.1 hypothetical protein COM71_19600 [Priestia megaterium]PFP15847.1 hypothetical protein COJ90_02195 [Priestia megaterium]PGO61184.1 hypothetical protein CN981_07490 [Priestia megaterium]PGR97716.1 hypothetical protein COC61_10055 [Priestia megaterium]
MKRFKKVIAFILVFAVLFSPLVPHTQAEAKVMWGNQELVKGQIGRGTILKNTSLYNIKNNKLVAAKKVSKGQIYRVYSYSGKYGGIYGVSKDLYAQKSSSIKYERAPSHKIQAFGITVIKKSLASNISYPQASGLFNKPFEASFNRKFLNLAKETQQANKELKEQEKEDRENGWSPGPYYQNMKYSVPYNQDNILSISITYDEYSGGAHGNAWIDTYNYDLLKAKQLSLKDVIKNQTQLGKVNKYIRDQMIVRNKKGAGFEVKDFKSVNLTQDQFYYTSGGIVIIFGEYEYGPYANGINFFKVPYSVFK